MMDFVRELKEARLIKTKSDLKLTFKEVCENLYLIILILEFLTRTNKGKKIAVNYAKESSKYINYSEFRTNATDLYNLLYLVQETPENVKTTFSSDEAKTLREKTQLPRMELNRWLIKLDDSSYRDYYFLMKLEQSLNISNSDYKEIRRMLNYKNPTEGDVKIMALRILNSVRFKMPLLDLKPDLENILSDGKISYIS